MTGPGLAGLIIRLALFAAAVMALNHYVRLGVGAVETGFWERHEQHTLALVIASVAVYVVLMALPFMPGIEVGIMLMVMMGSTGAVIAYFATLLSLTLSFAAGRLLRPYHLAAFLDFLYLRRAAAFIRAMDPLTPDQRMERLYGQAPDRLAPLLVKHRYLTVAALLNIPGNGLVGGGGGIGMVAGMSGLFRFPLYVLTVALAVAPVPLAVLAGFSVS